MCVRRYMGSTSSSKESSPSRRLDEIGRCEWICEIKFKFTRGKFRAIPQPHPVFWLVILVIGGWSLPCSAQPSFTCEWHAKRRADLAEPGVSPSCPRVCRRELPAGKQERQSASELKLSIHILSTIYQCLTQKNHGIMESHPIMRSFSTCSDNSNEP